MGAADLLAGQNPYQERGGALLYLCAPGDVWTRSGPVNTHVYLFLNHANSLTNFKKFYDLSVSIFYNNY